MNSTYSSLSVSKATPISIVAILLAAIGCHAADQSRHFSINGRKSEAEIHRLLCQATPIGSNFRNVASFLNQHLIHQGGYVPSVGNGGALHLVATGKTTSGKFEYNAVPDLTPRFGEKWIGQNFDLHVLLSFYQGLPFKVSVSAIWRFGRDGALKEIVVQKQADAL